MRGALTSIRSGLVAWTLLAALPADGSGPPLEVDDPGTADPGTLETIVSWVREERSSGTWDLGPTFDLSYGLTEQIELGAIIPIYHVDEDGSGSGSGLGHVAIGAKWRFKGGDRDAFTMAIVPTLLLDSADSDVDRGPAQSAMVFTAPFIAEYAPDPWRVGANLQYAWSRGPDEWFAGGYFGYVMFDRVEWLAEINTVAQRDLGDGDWHFNLGFNARLHDRFYLMGSVGRAIHNASDDRRKWRSFVGFQVILGEQELEPGEVFGPGASGRPLD